MDNERFLACREKARSLGSSGIGTLSERILHKTLKLYFEPDVSRHEIEYCGIVADVLRDSGVMEIQTRAFEKLTGKLEKLLPIAKVELVYPISVRRMLSWVDESTGDVSAPRAVSRRGRAADALVELSKIEKYLDNANLTITIVLIKTMEYKAKDGKGKDKKHGATRLERIPTELVDVIKIRKKQDYLRLIPESVPEEFTAKEFYKAAAQNTRRGYNSLRLLLNLGILEREKQGRSYVYRISSAMQE